MQAVVIRPFTMGDAKYAEGQEIDMPDWRITRLVGEGLVREVAGQEPEKEVTPAKVAPAPVQQIETKAPVKDEAPIKKPLSVTPKRKQRRK